MEEGENDGSGLGRGDWRDGGLIQSVIDSEGGEKEG